MIGLAGCAPDDGRRYLIIQTALRFGGTAAREIRCVPDGLGQETRSASLRRSFAKNRASVVVGGTTEVGRMSASRNSERGKTIVVIGFPARDTKHMPD
ncbi:MAG TPA: hypothetical protein P5179_14045, partial [Candidatus Latescibacteria bacterium]|nr:hypothetical protein [Candidatus Latescibacterota bacterium]